jgi:hypothetical protein
VWLKRGVEGTVKAVREFRRNDVQNGRRFGRKRDAKWQKIRAQKRCKMAEDSGAKEMQNGRRFGRKRGAKWQKIRAQKRCTISAELLGGVGEARRCWVVWVR